MRQKESYIRLRRLPSCLNLLSQCCTDYLNWHKVYLLYLGRDLCIYYINKTICNINRNICINFSYILTAAITTWYFRLIGLGCIRCKISMHSLIHVMIFTLKRSHTHIFRIFPLPKCCFWSSLIYVYSYFTTMEPEGCSWGPFVFI